MKIILAYGRPQEDAAQLTPAGRLRYVQARSATGAACVLLRVELVEAQNLAAARLRAQPLAGEVFLNAMELP